MVERLALVGTGPWFTGDRDGLSGGFSDEFTKWWDGQTASTGTLAADAYAALGQDWLYHEPPSDAVLAWFTSGALQWPLYVLNSYSQDMQPIDHRNRAQDITCPVLVLQGRHDRKQRYDGAQYLADLFPNGQLQTCMHSAHMPHHEEMETFNATLSDFIRNR